ncbi:putative disease resistance RPP13-like protein 1 [Trifolium pratense]|uniref:putative disease resistance RPP13-like protein 1 n=1 Tax=Trifolium pratense TaxID=57577 RepID=UPI001E6933BF|nr:putative disease resistance RPP13-like protein 1 [Trifolium pratense]
MAVALIGGSFLSASVQTLMDKLASKDFQDYFNNKNLNISLLRQLETTLLAFQAVLDDAEHKQINNLAVKQWLDELKDAIFDAEDLLNQISYDSLRCKMENIQAENITNQVRNFLSSPFKSFYGEINSQMKIMCQRLQLFAQQKDILGLQTVSGRVSRRMPSSSLVNESVIVGRTDDKQKLMNMLLSDRGIGNNIGVIAVLGMGGVGKTTLAQLLYNDKEVQEHFELKAWACVSEDFDILRVTKTLLESVTSRSWESNNLDFLRVELKKNSIEKRFLFVLDDMWNHSYNDWDELISPFINGKSGSRVIMTTRHQKVADVAHTFPIHKLDPLSDEDSWSLLSKHAFESNEFHETKHIDLEAIGRKIARKCGGLPIAAKTLGGLLRSKVDRKEWTAILNSDIWNLPNDNIMPALFLSYQYLPSHLKRCFAYCSIFPKDYFIDKKQLILLWMAEGFLEHSQGENAAEKVGDDYFVELLSRSLIQQYDTQQFVMHDLVNDLATLVSGKSCCRLECGDKISKNIRHFSYNQEEYDNFKKFEIVYDCKSLRSFLPIGSWRGKKYLSTMMVHDLLPSFRRLRVLSLSNYANLTILPNSVGSLVQLRYLDLSHTEIKSLPETTCNLYNLQTMLLSNCRNLTELPVHIGKLISLRHLDICGTNIKEMPMEIVGLESLQTLTFFVVGRQKVGLGIKELRKFPHLHGKLTIKNLHNVIDAMEAYDANLKSKEQIDELELQWGEQTEDSRVEKDVLDALKPSINLKKLSIRLYGGTSFPTWLGDSLFSNMVSLRINNCEYCVTLPPLGQLPSLKYLSISGMAMLETIGSEFYYVQRGDTNSSFQPFSSLERLEFWYMPNWKEWLPFEGDKFPFPRLKTLWLYQCPELRGHLPSHLSSIQEIEINGCHHLLPTQTTLRWLSSIKCITIMGSHWDTKGSQWSLLESDSPCLLQDVKIWCFHTLLYLPKMIINNNCLRHLTLNDIPSLVAFPVDGLPTSLQSLVIHRCQNLTFLPPETWSSYTSLVTLELWNSCQELTAFPLDGFPALQSIHIYGCKSLESIFISDCSPPRSSTLQSLSISRCKALPQKMDSLTALEHLSLYDLPKELKLPFCEGACLPPKLRSIYVVSAGIATPVTDWGLQHLSALSKLSIGGDDDIVTTLLNERLLPISLVSLTITRLSKMKSFEGIGLRHLSSLEKLQFRYFSRLKYLTEGTLPCNLKSLKFENCPRLESLSEDSLPSSLKRLIIRECPLLEERYGSERGEHWSKIAHIPVIKINDKVTI